MNNDLPEINFKEKKEKKGGILGWLRNRLGFGSQGGAMGEAGINPSAMNIGLGTAKIGASAGIGSFLAGNAGLIATVAVVTVAGGLYVARNSPSQVQNSSAFSSDKVASASNYVPAILRSQAANKGSSLDMFKATNKGAVSMDEPAKPAAKQAEASPAPAAGQQDQAAPDQNAPNAGDMAERMQGSMGGSLTSSLGGGSGQFSGMGGFSNKFNNGSTGLKTGMTGFGGSFAAMPKFDQRKNKMLAMKGAYKPQILSGKGSGKYSGLGSKAKNQLSAMRATQKSYTGGNIDSLRSTQDKAWEGTTGDGSASAGGAGMGDGGAGVVNTPSLDNAGSSVGGGSNDDVSVPDASGPTDESPWKSLLSSLHSMLMMAVMLSFVGYAIIKLAVGPLAWLKAVGIAICVAAAAMALMVVIKAIALMKTEMLMGMLYMVGGLATVGGAVGAMMEKPPKFLNPLWWLAGAGVLSLISSMLSGK